jgi:hypothetical protein
MILPTLNTNAPSNHPIIRMTAIMYNRSLMIVFTIKNEKVVPRRVERFNSTLWPLKVTFISLQLLNVEFITEYVDGGTGKGRFSFNL